MLFAFNRVHIRIAELRAERYFEVPVEVIFSTEPFARIGKRVGLNGSSPPGD